MTTLFFEVTALTAYHDHSLRGADPAVPSDDNLWVAITANHHCNRLLWDQEDRARCANAPAALIVDCKRRIDRHNQARNDAVEAIDDFLLQRFAPVIHLHNARRHSETPGAMMDRLSILSLKIFHMHRQIRRVDVSDSHRQQCAEKWQCLLQQRADLADCLDSLLREIRAGESYFTCYRQFKMYNDPAMSPWLQRAVPGRAE